MPCIGETRVFVAPEDLESVGKNYWMVALDLI